MSEVFAQYGYDLIETEPLLYSSFLPYINRITWVAWFGLLVVVFLAVYMLLERAWETQGKGVKAVRVISCLLLAVAITFFAVGLFSVASQNELVGTVTYLVGEGPEADREQLEKHFTIQTDYGTFLRVKEKGASPIAEDNRPSS